MAAVNQASLEQLARAVSADELEAVIRAIGAEHRLREGRLRIDGRLVVGGPPEVTLELDPPVDARELCTALGIERPVAVSPDVHQHTWSVLVAGDELPDPHGLRIASAPLTAGRWQIVPRLAQRPSGELPGVASGASPAYDIRERGGTVVSIEIAPLSQHVQVLDPDHAEARRLLAAMQAAHPVWRGGWTPDPATTFVTVDDGAGAVLADGGSASQICLVRDDLGPALLDALEAVARDRGLARLRLDSSAFLFGDALPYARYGYEVGPPYDGDADVEVWVEKDLR
jgi:hypothetical protein